MPLKQLAFSERFSKSGEDESESFPNLVSFQPAFNGLRPLRKGLQNS
jgi:hypothetical protein